MTPAQRAAAYIVIFDDLTISVWCRDLGVVCEALQRIVDGDRWLVSAVRVHRAKDGRIEPHARVWPWYTEGGVA